MVRRHAIAHVAIDPRQAPRRRLPASSSATAASSSHGSPCAQALRQRVEPRELRQERGRVLARTRFTARSSAGAHAPDAHLRTATAAGVPCAPAPARWRARARPRTAATPAAPATRLRRAAPPRMRSARAPSPASHASDSARDVVARDVGRPRRRPRRGRARRAGSSSASFSISWRAASRLPSLGSARNASVSGAAFCPCFASRAAIQRGSVVARRAATRRPRRRRRRAPRTTPTTASPGRSSAASPASRCPDSGSPRTPRAPSRLRRRACRSECAGRRAGASRTGRGCALFARNASQRNLRLDDEDLALLAAGARAPRRGSRRRPRARAAARRRGPRRPARACARGGRRARRARTCVTASSPPAAGARSARSRRSASRRAAAAPGSRARAARCRRTGSVRRTTISSLRQPDRCRRRRAARTHALDQHELARAAARRQRQHRLVVGDVDVISSITCAPCRRVEHLRGPAPASARFSSIVNGSAGGAADVDRVERIGRRAAQLEAASAERRGGEREHGGRGTDRVRRGRSDDDVDEPARHDDDLLHRRAVRVLRDLGATRGRPPRSPRGRRSRAPRCLPRSLPLTCSTSSISSCASAASSTSGHGASSRSPSACA